MRDYEYFEPVRPAPRPDKPIRMARPAKKPPKVNPWMLAMGDDLVLLGAFLRILARKRRPH